MKVLNIQEWVFQKKNADAVNQAINRFNEKVDRHLQVLPNCTPEEMIKLNQVMERLRRANS